MSHLLGAQRNLVVYGAHFKTIAEGPQGRAMPRLPRSSQTNQANA